MRACQICIAIYFIPLLLLLLIPSTKRQSQVNQTAQFILQPTNTIPGSHLLPRLLGSPSISRSLFRRHYVTTNTMATIKPQANPLHVIVVGAGLGGLAAAIATRLSGHNVTICEQAPALGEVNSPLHLRIGSYSQSEGWSRNPDPTQLCAHPPALRRPRRD